ncbi:MAG: enoyl-CoA hydratase/isomerase family protein [Notoacmeibacter sp.]|nr:enoyl-CoA hydratase/isomerase family protein [Notoacmeibacter sp.]MCC0031746.1 enoyl-CoA hydratase/isomerase family protein [Brucellaceae bacterium]
MKSAVEGLTFFADGPVARLVLDRPEKKNAVTQAMWVEIARIIEALGRDGQTRVLVLSGKGADFSAGADIGEFDTVRRDAATARAYEATNSRAFRALREAPFPVIAAISGICFGGGFGLAAACDLRIATPDARFAVPAGRLGLAYPQDAMGDIVMATGSQMARYLTFTAGQIGAEAALKAGFLLEIVADGEALNVRAADMARAVAENAPLSVRASKLAIRAVAAHGEVLAAQARDAGNLTFDSADYAEGRAAFKERRKAVFQGR